jgi:two-component system invasion response regulator UvrY
MRIFIADKNKEVRLALQVFLHQEAGVEIVGVTASSHGLAGQLVASETDILLLDWALTGQSMPELLTELRMLEPRSRVVVMALWPDVEQQALAAGADAFVSKSMPPSELVEMLRTMQQSTTTCPHK